MSIPAGCNKCGQQFMLPVDQDGQPIWMHNCPVDQQEQLAVRVANIEKMVADLSARPVSEEVVQPAARPMPQRPATDPRIDEVLQTLKELKKNLPEDRWK